MLILVLAWLLIQLVGAIRTKEPLVLIIAAAGLVLWLLFVLGTLPVPGRLTALQ